MSASLSQADYHPHLEERLSSLSGQNLSEDDVELATFGCWSQQFQVPQSSPHLSNLRLTSKVDQRLLKVDQFTGHEPSLLPRGLPLPLPNPQRYHPRVPQGSRESIETMSSLSQIRLEQKPAEPSEWSLKQLMRECKEALR